MKIRVFNHNIGKTKMAGMLLVAACVLSTPFQTQAQTWKYQHPETTELVKLVNDAAALVADKGESIFFEFMNYGTRWRHADTYVFVFDLKGDCYAHEDSMLISTNLYDRKDASGKPFVQWMIRKARGTGQCGWVHYQWLRSGTTAPSWKSSYVKLTRSPSGTFYLVGSGIFEMKMERDFAREAVEDAINLIVKEGRKALATLSDPATEYVFKDNYVYVLDTLGNMLVNPGSSGLVGQNQLKLKDVKGKLFIQELIRVAVDKAYGWVDYYWTKPLSTQAVPKTAFVKSVNAWGETFVVASGVYLDDNKK